MSVIVNVSDPYDVVNVLAPGYLLGASNGEQVDFPYGAQFGISVDGAAPTSLIYFRTSEFLTTAGHSFFIVVSSVDGIEQAQIEVSYDALDMTNPVRVSLRYVAIAFDEIQIVSRSSLATLALNITTSAVAMYDGSTLLATYTRLSPEGVFRDAVAGRLGDQATPFFNSFEIGTLEETSQWGNFRNCYEV